MTEAWPTGRSWAESLVVFDLETTGVSVEHDRVVTAHVGRLDREGVLVERVDWLVNPGIAIPAGASAVHGISTERAQADGVAAPQAIADIVSVLRRYSEAGLPIVAYNAAYDFSLLDREARRYGIAPFVPERVIDPLVIDKAVDRYRKGKRTLTVSCAHYGVSLDGAHEASADAIAAGRLAIALAAAFPQLGELSAEQLHAQQRVWSAEQAESFAKWRHSQGDTAFRAERGWPVRELFAQS